MIPNKGGLGISMSILSKKILFIGCHITSGQENVERRNKDLNHIEKSLSLTIDADCTIIAGDFNYRLDGHIEAIEYYISEGLKDKLISMDQLKNEMQKRNVVDGYMEGIINFPPTYKYEIGTNRFD